MITHGFCSNVFPANDLDSLLETWLPLAAKLLNSESNENRALDLQLGGEILK